MFQPIKIGVFTIIIAILFISCGNKKDDKTGDNKSGSVRSRFIQKDSATGKEKILLKYAPRKGEIFRYKLDLDAMQSENSPFTGGKEVSQNTNQVYYFSQEVMEVNEKGIITYKVKFDSIKITIKQDTNSVVYNSNINDSNRTSPLFFSYSAVVGQPFKFRLAPDGKIIELIELDDIKAAYMKLLPDSLNEKQKEKDYSQNFDPESLRGLIEEELARFKSEFVDTDQPYQFTDDETLLVFKTKATRQYKINNIKEENEKLLIDISGELNVEFATREYVEKGEKMKLDNFETKGTSSMTIDLARGIIVRKEVNVPLNIDVTLSAKGQSAIVKRKNQKKAVLTLLN
jgi:hypothetical protein